MTAIVYRENREHRNKRIAIEAIDLMADVVQRYNLPPMAFEAFKERWRQRGVSWIDGGQKVYDLDAWLSANDMADYLDVAAETVRRWYYRGHISSVDTSAGPVYNVGECVSYLARR